MVANAGFGVFGAAEELDDAEIDALLATNLTAVIQLTRAVLPHLRAQGGGRLLQVSSMGAHIAFPAFSLYHPSKWGIEGFDETVAAEVAPFGIDVDARRARHDPHDVLRRRRPRGRAPEPTSTCTARASPSRTCRATRRPSSPR